MRGVRLFQEFTDDCALVERLIVILESWDEAAGVEFEERLRFVVGIYLRVVKRSGSWKGER